MNQLIAVYLIGDQEGPDYADVPYDTWQAAADSASYLPGARVWRVVARVESVALDER